MTVGELKELLKDYDDQAIFSVNDSNRGRFFSGSMSVYEYDEGEVVLDLKTSEW